MAAHVSNNQDGRDPPLLLTIIGDIFCDVIATNIDELPKWGEDSLTQKIQILAGGSALNITVHGAHYLQYRSSIPTAIPTSPSLRLKLLSCTGGDLQGQLCKAKLQCLSNIDSSCIVSKDEWRTGSCVVLSGQYDRSFVTDRGCIDQLSTSLFDESMFQFNETCHFHVGGFYNCIKLYPEVLPFFKKVHDNNSHRGHLGEVTTSLNPQCDATGKYDFLPSICPYLTFFIGNEAEVRLVSKKGDEPPAERDEWRTDPATLQEQAQTLLDWGCQAVVVTRGRHGAVAYFSPTSSFALAEKNGHHHPSSSPSSSSSSSSQNHGTIHGHSVSASIPISRPRSSSTGEIESHHRCCSMIQATPLVDPVIDTTGAGDAFAGAFLVEWCLTKDLRNSLRAGCCAGSAAVTLVGGSTYTMESLETAHKKLSM